MSLKSFFDFSGEGNTGQFSNIDRMRERAVGGGTEPGLLEDALFRSMNLGLFGASEGSQQDVFRPLQNQLGAIDSNFGLLDGLAANLRSSALASTSGAQISASNAARLSGSGRYGGGGNAALTAARGASQAAGGQSAALSQALVQGQLGRAQYQSQLLQQRGLVSQSLSQAYQNRVSLQEQRGRAPLDIQLQTANVLAGFAGIDAGIATQRLAGDASRDSAFIGAISNYGSSYNNRRG